MSTGSFIVSVRPDVPCRHRGRAGAGPGWAVRPVERVGTAGPGPRAGPRSVDWASLLCRDSTRAIGADWCRGHLSWPVRVWCLACTTGLCSLTTGASCPSALSAGLCHPKPPASSFSRWLAAASVAGGPQSLACRTVVASRCGLWRTTVAEAGAAFSQGALVSGAILDGTRPADHLASAQHPASFNCAAQRRTCPPMATIARCPRRLYREGWISTHAIKTELQSLLAISASCCPVAESGKPGRLTPDPKKHVLPVAANAALGGIRKGVIGCQAVVAVDQTCRLGQLRNRPEPLEGRWNVRGGVGCASHVSDSTPSAASNQGPRKNRQLSVTRRTIYQEGHCGVYETSGAQPGLSECRDTRPLRYCASSTPNVVKAPSRARRVLGGPAFTGPPPSNWQRAW